MCVWVRVCCSVLFGCIQELGHPCKQGHRILTAASHFMCRNMEVSGACHPFFTQDYEEEMDAVTYAAGKCWSNLRRLWNNAKDGSNHEKLQQLKDLMCSEKKKECLEAPTTPKMELVQAGLKPGVALCYIPICKRFEKASPSTPTAPEKIKVEPDFSPVLDKEEDAQVVLYGLPPEVPQLGDLSQALEDGSSSDLDSKSTLEMPGAKRLKAGLACGFVSALELGCCQFR